MKYATVGLLAALGLATGMAAAAQPSATAISVSGTGRVVSPPDVATVDAAVETNAANANDAVSQNNAIYNRIVAALEKLGIPRADVTLAYYNVGYNPRPKTPPADSDGTRYGYTVSRGFNVKVRAIAHAGAVADACTGAGATAINGVSFGLSDPSAARSEATQRAVADARASAEDLARAAGLHLVSIKSIALQGAGPFPPPPTLRMSLATPSTEFDQSNVTVSVSVSVTFVAQP